MPVYNESRTLRTIVGRVLSSPIDLDIEIVAVDDGSKDDSVAILNELAAEDPRIRVIVQPHNMGKGKAIRTAIHHMTGDIGIIQDADLEYDPHEYPRILKPILEGKADAVYGSRFATSEERRVLYFWHPGSPRRRNGGSSTSGIRWATRSSPPCPTWPPT